MGRKCNQFRANYKEVDKRATEAQDSPMNGGFMDTLKPATPLPGIAGDTQLAKDTARKLYEKGQSASSIVSAMRHGGHSVHTTAEAVKYLSEMDAMLFGESWGGNEIEKHAARHAFLGARGHRVSN